MKELNLYIDDCYMETIVSDAEEEFANIFNFINNLNEELDMDFHTIVIKKMDEHNFDINIINE